MCVEDPFLKIRSHIDILHNRYVLQALLCACAEYVHVHVHVCACAYVCVYIRTSEFKYVKIYHRSGTFNKLSSLEIIDEHLVGQTNQGLPKILPQYPLETALTVT